MNKLRVGIIGSGNIGTDLMYKIERAPFLDMRLMVGIDPLSEGLKRAAALGYKTIDNGIQGLESHIEEIDILFDATSAYAHAENAALAKKYNKKMIDLTPAALGPFIVPSVNLSENLDKENVNMVTCGGQATIPIVHAINRITPVEYAEIVATVASKSAGPGTRANIDEFTRTTARAIEQVGGAKKGKAIIILNPAEPPVMMRDTVHALIPEDADHLAIITSIKDMVKDVQQYVPGYRLCGEPVFDENRISVFLEVEGAGDFFPAYSGNLDIMTAAATRVANTIAQNSVERGGALL